MAVLLITLWLLSTPSHLSRTVRQLKWLPRPPYYLINTWLHKLQILQGIRDTIQGLRKYKVCKKSFVWLPWQLFDNMVLFTNNCQNDYEKISNFQMPSETTN